MDQKSRGQFTVARSRYRLVHCGPALVTVTVTDGVVTVGSMPEAAITGHKIAGEVRHMEGVVAVREGVIRSAGGER